MITLKFCKDFDCRNVRIIELDSYKSFFDFYMENNNRGIIYDVFLAENSLMAEVYRWCNEK